MIESLLVSCVMIVPPPKDADVSGILNAIRIVETGGVKNPSKAVGDSGKAIGPYQIHKVYWQDAIEYDPSIGGSYHDCRDKEYADKIVIAYMSRYAPNWNPATVSRIHNGGPSGHKRKSTIKYWLKVKENL